MVTATRHNLPGSAHLETMEIPRSVCFLFGHELTLNPFYSTESYLALASLPFAERIAALRRPEVRARILAEPIDPDPANVLGRMVRDFNRMFALGDPPDYEPALENSIAAQANLHADPA